MLLQESRELEDVAGLERRNPLLLGPIGQKLAIDVDRAREVPAGPGDSGRTITKQWTVEREPERAACRRRPTRCDGSPDAKAAAASGKSRLANRISPSSAACHHFSIARLGLYDRCSDSSTETRFRDLSAPDLHETAHQVGRYQVDSEQRRRQRREDRSGTAEMLPRQDIVLLLNRKH